MFSSFSKIDHGLFAKAILSVKEYGIFTLNPEGTVVTWGIGAANVQGYTEEEVVGTSFARLYEKEVNKPQGYFAEILDKAKVHDHFEEEGWRQHKDGSYYWSIILIKPIYDKDNVLVAYGIISRDLTDRKLAAEMSEISEARDDHRAMVLATSSIIWIRGGAGQFLVPHLQWEHYTGQIWPKYKGDGWLEMHPPSEHDKIKAFWTRIQALDLTKLRQKNWQELQSATLADSLTLKTLVWSKIHQEYRNIITTIVPHSFGAEGKVAEWLGNEKDVHKAVLLANELKKAVDTQYLILSSVRIGLWQWDLESNRIDLDSNTAAYLGINLDNFTCGINEILAQIHPEDRFSTQAAFKKCIEEGQQLNTEFRVVWPDGSIHHIAGRGNIELNSQKKPSKLLGSYWDITETKQIFEERTRAKLAEMRREEQGIFVNTVCHEIRNSASSVIGVLEELQEILGDFKEVQTEGQLRSLPIGAFTSKIKRIQEIGKTIRNCVDHQSQVTERVVDISAIRDNQIILHPEVFFLNKAIGDALKNYVSSGEKKIHIKDQSNKENISIKADKKRFIQIIDYIFGYAVRNMQEHGVIEFSSKILSQQGKHIEYEIIIKISNLYISQERKLSIFHRYMPISHHDKQEYSSESYGLAISRGLTQLLGGTINIESDADNGSIFYLNFNFERAEPEAVLAHNRFFISPSYNKDKKILIVEDNEIVQNMLKRVLGKRGYQCRTASNGKEAVDIYLEFSPDWIFMDIEMPVMTGLEATQSIRKKEEECNLPHVPICALTAYSNAEFELEARKAGVTEYIVKPPKFDEIDIMLNQYFQHEGRSAEVGPSKGCG